MRCRKIFRFLLDAAPSWASLAVRFPEVGKGVKSVKEHPDRLLKPFHLVIKLMLMMVVHHKFCWTVHTSPW